MTVYIKDKKNYKEICEQIRFDEDRLGFNHEAILLAHLKETFGMVEGELVII